MISRGGRWRFASLYKEIQAAVLLCSKSSGLMFSIRSVSDLAYVI